MAQERTETPISVTGFPWCGKPITPGAGALTNWSGQPQPMTVRVQVAATIVYRPMGNPVDQNLTNDFIAGEYIPCPCSHIISATDATGLTGYY